jgi:uncharacterized SAM-binding protein YcdF (DUF218 family)
MIKKLFLSLAIAIVLVIVIPVVISLYLSPQDELQKADAIVVISGGDTDARISEGVHMYLQKWSDKIIFSGAAASGDVSNALSMKRIAIADGIPAENIIIEENSKTTSENAQFTADILKQMNANSIILVTSPYHQRRANNEFRKVLGKDFVIINHSAMDTTWRKKNWWEDSRARFLTLGEILKNFYSLIGGK